MAGVSVVIPAYNAEHTVGAAIASVLGQTRPPDQVIVVDDGSTDRTAEVIESHGSPVECVRTVNQGVSEARNQGMRRSEGEFVALLDADDVWEPEKLERQLAELARRQDAGVSTTGSLRVDSELRPVARTPAQDPPDPCATLLLHSMVMGNLSSPLIRRQVMQEMGGFDPSFSQCADWDYFLRLGLRTTFAVIPDPLVRYRVTGESMSSDIGLLERDTMAVLDRFFDGDPPTRYMNLRSRVYSNHWMILSGSYLHAGQPSQALRCMLRSIQLYPRNVTRPLGMPSRWLKRLGSRPRGSVA